MARIKINGKIYAEPELDKITLRDLLAFDAECAEAGIPHRWGDVEAFSEEISDLAKKDKVAARRHPSAVFLGAATIWLAQRVDEQPPTIAEVLDRPLGEVEYLKDVAVPADRKRPTKGAAAKKAAPRKRSGAATGSARKGAAAARTSTSRG